jgi:hypothetical protein
MFPGFPVEVDGVVALHAAFLNESRTRGHVWLLRNRKSGRTSVHGPKKTGAARQSLFLYP